MQQLLLPLSLRLSLLAAALLLTACAGTNQGTGPSLEQQLADAQREIRELKQTEQQLRDSINDLRHTTTVLTTEKTSRVQESSSLRGEVRKFVQANIDNLKEFMVKGNLLDYIGSEQVPRSKQDGSAMFLVDFANPAPADGALTGVGGFFTNPGMFYVKILRPVGGQYVVIWESKTIDISASGKQFVQFPFTVGIERGDVLGYYFPQQVNVGYDTSTGDTLYNSGDQELGSSLSKTFMSGVSQRRAYSIGVYGLLN